MHSHIGGGRLHSVPSSGLDWIGLAGSGGGVITMFTTNSIIEWDGGHKTLHQWQDSGSAIVSWPQEQTDC